MKHIVITGVSSGIGKSIALELLKGGYFIIGTVRNKSDSVEFYEKFPDNFKHIECDLTQPDSIKDACGQIKSFLGSNNLFGLINNSGIAIGGPLMHQSIEEIKSQFEVNLFGLINMTQELLPLLGASMPPRKTPGRIINMSSTNGKISFPYIGAYSATKFALEAISDALRYELNIYGIKVVLIEPGIIKTKIWDKAEEADITQYKNTDYFENMSDFKTEFVKIGNKGLEPETVSTVVKKALEISTPKSRYVITNKYFSEWLLPRILPDKYLDSIIIKEVGLTKDKTD